MNEQEKLATANALLRKIMEDYDKDKWHRVMGEVADRVKKYLKEIEVEKLDT